MSGRHGREAYYIAGEGMRSLAPDGTTTTWVADWGGVSPGSQHDPHGLPVEPLLPRRAWTDGADR